MFREGWLNVNSTPTHVLSWGAWIQDDIQADSLLIFIPGNPGITDFYIHFLQTLHNVIRIPIWIVNHAGGEPVPENLASPSLEQYPELYNLSGQVKHKKDFIETYVPPDTKLFLIGHSVGGKMCVELMKDEKISSRLVQAHLVFPTLQHIAESFNGKIYKHVIQHIIPLLVSFAWVFAVLPCSVRRGLLSLVFWVRRDWRKCHKESCLEGILKLFTPQVTKAALTLAKDEIHQIKELDTQIYEAHYDKIYCYYGAHDDWAPLSQYHHLMENHPKVTGMVLDRRFSHAFVLTAPADMAQQLAKNISPAIKSSSISEW